MGFNLMDGLTGSATTPRRRGALSLAERPITAVSDPRPARPSMPGEWRVAVVIDGLDEPIEHPVRADDGSTAIKRALTAIERPGRFITGAYLIAWPPR